MGSLCSPLPSSLSYSNTRLPDPFTFLNGTKVTDRAGWNCRREELRQLIIREELGVKLGKPSLTASYSGGTLRIVNTVNGKTLAMSVSIRLPTSGTGPFPAIIAFGSNSISVPNNVAVITYNNDQVASTTAPGYGVGEFYNLYGTGSNVGALVAWGWGVSRIIDTLEITPAANIDPKRIGVTGCSRNGKEALIAGALDDRVALTIPQESGCGGSGCYRIAQSMRDAGENVEVAANLISGTGWLSPNMAKYSGNNINQLAEDHHVLNGIIAPRGLLINDNSGIDWLGGKSSWGCSLAGRLIYQALGVRTNFGTSQFAHGDHCVFKSQQQPEPTAFINNFLLGQSSTNTDFFKTDQAYPGFTINDWVNWPVPDLSGGGTPPPATTTTGSSGPVLTTTHPSSTTTTTTSPPVNCAAK